MLVDADAVQKELSYDPERALGLDDTAFQKLLEGEEGDEYDDGIIGREIERVEDELDISLTKETTTETLSRPSGVEAYDLPLPQRPVVAVESLSIDTERVHGPDVDLDDVIVHDTHLELQPDADRKRWPTDRRSIDVEWTHGYDAETLPGPVRAAIIGLVRAALQEIEADGIESESIGDQSVSYELRDDVVARHLRRAKRFDEPSYYGGAMMI